MVMNARVMLGWVDPAELEAEEASEEVEVQADA
jgi:N utilization substance protein A